jgi:ABC-type sugar transport system substrate-binding protein
METVCRDKAMKAAEDLLQGFPDLGISGISDGSALGPLSASLGAQGIVGMAPMHS